MKRNAPSGKQYAQFVGVEKAAAGERKLTFIITTASVDRMNDVIELDGWDWSAWKQNPVVLWAHDQRQPPIAKGTKIWREGEVIKATAEFPTAEEYPFGDQVFRLIQGGYLQACSVGFYPQEWNWAEDKGRPFGINFKKQELLEFSVVPVPANPDALLQAKSAGVAVDLVEGWARQVLRQPAPPATAPFRALPASIRAVIGRQSSRL